MDSVIISLSRKRTSYDTCAYGVDPLIIYSLKFYFVPASAL
ncbi:hypothetical protein NMS_2142 [Nonlabens marinus S1-08]|uniref:Uncharacterized protein n=1 Tax=Nonlabens marinus S1-08 TaxID=1454201 RepID=W8W0D8_9FLAO|nr:hypothetical protein NMS_2142 [Nonlabens marinus S1-08]